jgi:hypothetical protein
MHLRDHLVSAQRSDDGIFKPGALAVAKLSIVENFVACSAGKSAGLAPLKICDLDRLPAGVLLNLSQLEQELRSHGGRPVFDRVACHVRYRRCCVVRAYSREFPSHKFKV